MININKIKPGNHLIDGDGNIITVMFGSIESIAKSADSYSGIKITECCLGALGFEHKEADDSWEHPALSNLHLHYDKNINKYFVHLYQTETRDASLLMYVDHIHILQNVILFLTGTEIKLKEDGWKEQEK